MGFFKSIGKAIKKGVKAVSIKNIVKLGTPLLSAIPVVGGMAQNIVGNLSEAHEIKKQAEAETNAVKKAQLEQLAYEAQVKAMSGTGSITGAIAGGASNAFINGAVGGLKDGALNGAGALGSAMVDSTINVWFKTHWKKLAMGVGALILAVLAYKKWGGAKRRPTRRR